MTNKHKQVRTSNSNARFYVKDLIQFKGSNTFGIWKKTHNDDMLYVVYSYGYHWPLFIYDNQKWYENSSYASPTTSKHESQLHPCTSTESRTLDDMLKIAEHGSMGLFM